MFYLYSNMTDFGDKDEIIENKYEYYLFFHEERIKEGEKLENIFFD